MSSDATMLSPGGDAARRESQAPASKHRAKPGKGQSTASKAKGELKQAKIDFSKAKPFKPEGLESKKRKRNEDQVVDLELELPTDRVDDSLSPELPGDVERGDGSNDRKLVDGNEGKIDRRQPERTTWRAIVIG